MKRLNNKRRWIATPTSSARNDGQKGIKGFTLVELVIVIAIVIILSVVSVPIYRGYTKSAKMSEAYALFGLILSSEKAYYSQYGNFYISKGSGLSRFSAVDVALGIDARSNKYFTWFASNTSGGGTTRISSWVYKPEDLCNSLDKPIFQMIYNIESGPTFRDNQSVPYDE